MREKTTISIRIDKAFKELLKSIAYEQGKTLSFYIREQLLLPLLKQPLKPTFRYVPKVIRKSKVYSIYKSVIQELKTKLVRIEG